MDRYNSHYSLFLIFWWSRPSKIKNSLGPSKEKKTPMVNVWFMTYKIFGNPLINFVHCQKLVVKYRDGPIGNSPSFRNTVVPKDLWLTIYETGLSPICVVLVFLLNFFAFLKTWCDIFYKLILIYINIISSMVESQLRVKKKSNLKCKLKSRKF